MELIQDSDYILFNAMAENVICGLAKPLKRLNEQCEILSIKYAKLRAKFLESGTYDELGESSKQLRELEQNLIKMLAVQDRLEKIVQRNKKRQELFKSRFETVGIYNLQADKKEISKLVSKEVDNITEDALNLNAKGGENLSYKFFGGEILVFKDGKLDLSLVENENVLRNASSSFFHELVDTFPYAVGTIPDEAYLSSKIKTNVLKESVLYVASKMKTQSIAESNRQLGGLLANSSEIGSIETFARELKNYLNVLVKQSFRANAPDLITEINQTLKCNEASEFLPRSKRVAVLANGIALDAPKTEAEESEEVRKEQEEAAKEQITREDLLNLLLADEEEDLELQETIEKIEKKSEEERKLNEKQQEELDMEELERGLESALKKNDTVED